MDNRQNIINWFEIPSNDLDRAISFYETILAQSMQRQDMNGSRYALFPHRSGVGGGIAQHKNFKPSTEGVLIYLNAGDDLTPILDRVKDAGGKVEMGKTLITEQIGYMAIIHDTEGNRVALHSNR